MHAKNCLLKLFALALALVLALAAFGCGDKKAENGAAAPASTVAAKPAGSADGGKDPDKAASEVKAKAKDEKKLASDDRARSGAREKRSYTMKDVKGLNDTKNFSKNAIEHIFDGTINKKGKATGYHYSMVEDSAGKIVSGTRSKKDAHGVFTAKVEVGGVKKEGFSSFYPEEWSPDDVVEAINEAYRNALADPGNPHGSLWIGHSGDIEIDMYLDSDKKIVTAYPVFVRR